VFHLVSCGLVEIVELGGGRVDWDGDLVSSYEATHRIFLILTVITNEYYLAH
jgi:hypothetical protein